MHAVRPETAEPQRTVPNTDERAALKTSGDFPTDALFGPTPSTAPSKPKKSMSLGTMRRVVVPLAPPPPPVVAQGSSDAFGIDMDLDFAMPLEQSIPPAPAADFDPDEAARLSGVESTQPSEGSSHLKPIEPMLDEGFEFADQTEVWGAAELDSQHDAIEIDPLPEPELMLEAELPLPPPVLVPTYAPAEPRPLTQRPSVDVNARRLERAERVRALIAEGSYADALDLIELLRASANDGLAEQLDRECSLAQQATTVPEPDAIDYEAALGGLGATLAVVAQSAVIRTMDLDHRAGYLLSLIDGVSTVEDIIDVASMPREQTLALLVDLKQRGLVG